jgi:DNA mismatch repair protein MutS
MRPSILYPEGSREVPAPLQDLRFANDLGLDQVFAAAVSGREGLELLELFYSPLKSLDQVAYRHEVLADLEHAEITAAVKTFLEQMARVRELLHTGNSLHTRLQKQRLFLDAVVAYCDEVNSLATSMSSMQLASRALRSYREYLVCYVGPAAFSALGEGAHGLIRSLSSIRYKVYIKGARVTVSAYYGEPDYAREVEAAFVKVREEAVTDYTAKLLNLLDMNQVEARVLDCVARLYPAPFSSLGQFFDAHQDFMDRTIVDFERASQFYLAYLEYIAPLRARGLQFCYPRVSLSPGPVQVEGLFDLALAASVVSHDGAGPARVEPNDLELSRGERVVVVTGPNSGGKTTFCRAIGQVHYLASLGLPVPARSAALVLADGSFTSFMQAEALEVARSHLEDELVHLHEVIERATPRSVVIMNESFSSTTLSDAAVLGKAVLAQLTKGGVLCA